MEEEEENIGIKTNTTVQAPLYLPRKDKKPPYPAPSTTIITIGDSPRGGHESPRLVEESQGPPSYPIGHQRGSDTELIREPSTVFRGLAPQTEHLFISRLQTMRKVIEKGFELHQWRLVHAHEQSHFVAKMFLVSKKKPDGS